MPSNSTTEALVLLSATIYFIGCCLKSLEYNVLELCNMYVFNMKKLFQKTPVELPQQPSPIKKFKSLLHAIGGDGYVKPICQKLPPPKKKRSKRKNK